MQRIQILHNPRCSKSRQTLQLLEDKGYTVEITEYLKTPLNQAQLADLYSQLELDNVLDMMRPKEAEFKQAGLDKATITKEQAFAAMVDYPKLLERPVVIFNNQARIGRPPEAVLEIL